MICRKRILGCVASLVAVVLLFACGDEIDMGYPSKVAIGADGGETVLYGTTMANSLEVMEGGNSAPSIEWEQLRAEITDSIDDSTPGRIPESVTGRKASWAKVILYCVYDKPRLVIKATPNTTGKTRKLQIHLLQNEDYCEMDVVQGAQ